MHLLFKWDFQDDLLSKTSAHTRANCQISVRLDERSRSGHSRTTPGFRNNSGGICLVSGLLYLLFLP